ncbi:hypothetical protein HNQ59_002110 [Chitinivorax tropicus]|uniref:Phosphoglycerate mutase n=1 Tax=Chitinivorax tropicus TaxID=714531 RepID=A0A840MP73_9PROT|nr:phosphoglycerate mutase [Chitinivorax tropicus]MBB5018817.1 hypothetical protein [Chitinivorax tropicus]
MHLTLVIPHLFWPDPDLPEIYQDLPLPALSWLLSRSTRQPQPLSADDWLAHTFGLPDQATAPISLQAEGCKPGQDYWLHADPVHLQINRDQLILADSGILSISQHEADQLIDSLNRHFAADGLQFVAPYPSRWYVRCQTAPQITTKSVHRVIGQDIHRHLPVGADAMHWHQTLNEIQMLLYTHPVNDARDAAGDPLINSLWFWGGGIWQAPTTPAYDCCWADPHLVSALVQTSGLRHEALPATAAAWFEHAQQDRQWIWQDALCGPAWYSDAHGWREALSRLEQDWFHPLKTALTQGRLASLTIIAPEMGEFTLTPRAAWLFWKRTQSLATWAPTQHAAQVRSA